MCRVQSVLAVLAFCVGVAHSWDVAVSAGDQLLFYTNGIKTNNVTLKSQNLTALAYDEIHNVMLYVDKQNDNDAVCGYDIFTEDNFCFIKRSGRNIQGLAFDPVTGMIFFSDTNERSINSISLEQSDNDVYGNSVIKMDDDIPTSISVDSCRGYIYWTNINPTNPTIEKARFDGSEREVVISTTAIYSYATYHYMPHSLFIDQQTQKIYWIEDMTIPSQYDLKSADLNGENKYYILSFLQQLCPPSIMTGSKNFLYWVGCSWIKNSVNELPKNARTGTSPEHAIHFSNERPAGITANYKIGEQMQGVQQCEKVRNHLNNMAVSKEFFKIPKDDDQICINGVKAIGQSRCKCAPGYIGERCDTRFSVCEHYCLHGNCSINDEQLPECWCNAGYSGQRCEVNLCYNYCLNDGDCSLNEDGVPVCQCVGNYEGSRCEVDINNTCTFTNTSSYSAQRNVTLADLLSNRQKPTVKVTVTVQV